jgi:PAS domain S-box-containing protein
MRRGMDSLGSAVLWARPEDGRILYGNRAALSLLGCAEAKLLDLHVPEIDAGFQDGGWSEFVDEVRRFGVAECLTLILNSSDQSVSADMECSLVPLDDDEVVVCFLRPVSESLEAARTLDAQLALITDSLPILIARVDRNLRFTYVNKGYERLFGKERKEMVGKNIAEVIGESNISGLKSFVDRVFLGETVTFERTLFRTALGMRVIRGTFSPDTSEDGRVVGYFVLGQDITSEVDVRNARELSEQRAVTAKGQLLDAIESISTGFALFDADDKLVVSNKEFRAAFPLIEKYIKAGAVFSDLVRRYADSIDKLRASDEARERFIRTRLGRYRRASGYFEYSTPGGRWYRVTDSRTRDGGSVITHDDITETKMREMHLLAAKDEADSINRMKTEFLANMSHELRTPLNAIIGFSDMMENELFGPIPEPKYVEYIVDIKQSGLHLLEVINDILDYAKIESGTFSLDRNPVDLNEAVESSLRILTARIDEKNLQLAVDIASDIPVIMGDRRRIVQLALNLLSNAIKFTPEGGRIEVRVARNMVGDIEFSVSDTGIGISQENLTHIADPFFQVDGTLARRHEGTGLGLTLCKMFVEMHGGSLRVHSVVGEGTMVTARFPAELAHEEPEAEPAVVDNFSI